MWNRSRDPFRGSEPKQRKQQVLRRAQSLQTDCVFGDLLTRRASFVTRQVRTSLDFLLTAELLQQRPHIGIAWKGSDHAVDSDSHAVQRISTTSGIVLMTSAEEFEFTRRCLSVLLLLNHEGTSELNLELPEAIRMKDHSCLWCDPAHIPGEPGRSVRQTNQKAVVL